MQGLLLGDTMGALDVLNPVDLTAPLNLGLLNWHLVLPHAMGGVTWKNLVAPRDAVMTGSEPRSPTQGWNATARRGGLGDMRFNGTSTNGSLASSSVYDFAETTFTVSCWFYAAVAGQCTLVSRRLNAGATGAWFMRTEAAGTATARLYNGSGALAAQRVSVGTTLVNGAWHHLLCVFTTHPSTNAANDMTFYVDGNVDQGVRTAGTGGYAPPPTRAVTLGMTDPGVDFLTGAMDDVRIYTRGLSATEVQQLYQASRTGYRRELRWLSPPLPWAGGVSLGILRQLMQHHGG